MGHDPLSPSEALHTRTGAALAAVSLLVFVYSLVVVGQILLGVIVAGGLSVGLYLTYHTIVVLDSVADAAQRVAAAKEREVDAGGGSRRVARDEASDGRSETTGTVTDRDR